MAIRRKNGCYFRRVRKTESGGGARSEVQGQERAELEIHLYNVWCTLWGDVKWPNGGTWHILRVKCQITLF